ncbi:MAG: hypothetical protein J7K29_03815, partial [Candidatus Cloacimonetes bacterium]|nr:hypothetical protein [Candidatus Cloacimonadota bacterium]
MKLKELLKLMKMPIIIISIVIILFSILSYFFGFQLTLAKNTSLIMRIMYALIYQLDITHHLTFATLFTSFVILLCATGFLLIGWGNREKLKINSNQQGIIKLFSVIMLFFASKDTLGLSDQLGKKLEYAMGFSRLFIYIPLILTGILIFILLFGQLIKNIRTVKKRVLTNHYFKSVILLTLIYLILIISDGYLS